MNQPAIWRFPRLAGSRLLEPANVLIAMKLQEGLVRWSQQTCEFWTFESPSHYFPTEENWLEVVLIHLKKMIEPIVVKKASEEN